MEFQQRNLCRIVALLISCIGSASTMAAGPLIQGGGSLLVGPVIGAIGNAGTEIGMFGTTEGSFTYYATSPGGGQAAFLNNQPTYLNANLTGTIDFANTDITLQAADIASYRTGLGATSGPLIQIPYVVTPITIPIVNGPIVTSTTTPQTTPNHAHSIALNDDDLCGIFSGKLTNWNQVINPETGSPYAFNASITVIYRPVGDDGANKMLTRHLAAVCSPSNTAAGVTFVERINPAASFPNGIVPANFVAATSSSASRIALLSSTGAAVSYLTPAHTNAFLAPSSGVVATPGAAQLPVASLVNTNDGKYYAPTYSNAAMALGTARPPNDRTTASNPAAWVPDIGNPVAGYPVSYTSQIILSQCYLDPNVKIAIHDFLSSHYTNASFASIVHGNGFDTVPPNFRTAISNTFLSNANGYSLDIGNTSVCTGTITGR
ncbi:phosphate ABC transporter substrate-binding protein [Burkholderia lata]|uniref:substrate-binding domain-containing protein n=1 Tax=Burkholderia lata (strain ATCC 17760 / DSM 23089 / LMG 22485 / NCIMB 9086 / R18194 / 383) TaxID=482957 RepID=UPI001452E4BF|nr:substrate-binding domain-containing protein [Burkholderia lata]VWC44369.1 phosphate ABC transporter substrate-binding protein [Burkholderia lata]